MKTSNNQKTDRDNAVTAKPYFNPSTLNRVNEQLRLLGQGQGQYDHILGQRIVRARGARAARRNKVKKLPPAIYRQRQEAAAKGFTWMITLETVKSGFFKRPHRQFFFRTEAGARAYSQNELGNEGIISQLVETDFGNC